MDLKINLIPVEIIQQFDDYIIIQEIDSKEIYTIFYYEFDSNIELSYNEECDELSNIISIEGWLSCQGNPGKTKKRQPLKKVN